MGITVLTKELQSHFSNISKESTHLFEINLDKDELWNIYLDSFPKGTNEIFRERREYDCGSCRQFIKNIGNVISLQDNMIETIWDFEPSIEKFKPVVRAMSKFVKSNIVSDVFVTKSHDIGIIKNHEKLESGEILTWNHLNVQLPTRFVHKGVQSVAEVQGNFRDTRNVFKRSLDEISLESVETVLELIGQNSLYKGDEWKSILAEFLKYKKEYTSLLSGDEENNYAWEQSIKAGAVIGRIRNHSIGTLLINISESMDLDTAVKKYEAIVAPSNYKRPKAIFTKKMLEDAQDTITELGYLKSLDRRYAALDDITINNILFSNKDSAKRIGGADIFEDMAKDISINTKEFSKVEEIAIDDFISNVLPTTKEVEVLLENKHSKNMISLIAPENKGSKTMFKWDNNFSWAYSGNMTDSSMKENVKSAGGNVEGVLRFSIQWNDGEYNGNDFDAHCIEPNGNRIYYMSKNNRSTSGELDVDIQRPSRNIPAVENITWTNKQKMQNGTYKFLVNNYAHRGGRSGFKAEIEFDGQIYAFDYNKDLKDEENVYVAEVTLKDGDFSIKELLPSSVSSKEVWNLKTNQFIPVSVIMNSPNYWNEQQGIGHKHFFFMLKDCVNPESPNGFYNEFLKQELVEHKRVFEALGGKMAVKDIEDQLSGVGFSSTKRDELTIKVKGSTERVLKLNFKLKGENYYE